MDGFQLTRGNKMPEETPFCPVCDDSGWIEIFEKSCPHCNEEGDQR